MAKESEPGIDWIQLVMVAWPISSSREPTKAVDAMMAGKKENLISESLFYLALSLNVWQTW